MLFNFRERFPVATKILHWLLIIFFKKVLLGLVKLYISARYGLLLDFTAILFESESSPHYPLPLNLFPEANIILYFIFLFFRHINLLNSISWFFVWRRHKIRQILIATLSFHFLFPRTLSHRRLQFLKHLILKYIRLGTGIIPNSNIRIDGWLLIYRSCPWEIITYRLHITMAVRKTLKCINQDAFLIYKLRTP